jgi:hypothetical protein
MKTHVKQILIDQFIQNWRSEIGNSSRGHFYSLFKQEFCIEPYLLQKQSILHLMLMSRGYLPNSPYTKQFGVVTLTPKILFENWFYL